MISVPEVDCEDDAIGWSIDVANLVELPPAQFEVECARGWGHDVETRAASEVVELPNAFQVFAPHPQGGLLLIPYGRQQLWSGEPPRAAQRCRAARPRTGRSAA